MTIDPLNILFLVLSISVFFITIFLCMTLYHIIQVLKDVEEVVEKANNTVDQVNEYIAKPLKIAMEIVEKTKYFVNLVQERMNRNDDSDEKEEKSED